MTYRIAFNHDQVPTPSQPVTQATDMIWNEQDFVLYIDHLLAFDRGALRRAFRYRITHFGQPEHLGEIMNGEGEVAYEQAREAGVEKMNEAIARYEATH